MNGGYGRKQAPLYGGPGSHDNTIFNRIMLRFRPIAPKPATEWPSSEGATPEHKNDTFQSIKRTKRKYVRVRRNSGYKRKDKRSFERTKGRRASEKSVVTLQLMPEETDSRRDKVLEGRSWCNTMDLDLTVEKIGIQDNQGSQTRLNLEYSAGDGFNGGKTLDQTAEMSRKEVVLSWITVVSMTDTCMDPIGFGCTDVEKMRNIGRDTCPGFISDRINRVQWVNEAYRRIVGAGNENDQGDAPEVMVWLVTREDLLSLSHQAFTCGVRLQYTWQNEKHVKMVPCDVWRLDFGGFAWRLDIKAALSLGV